MKVEAYVRPKPICFVTRDIATIRGLRSWRGQPMPQCTAASVEPRQVLGTPMPSPENSMSKQPRSATRAISSYISTSGKVRPTQDPGIRQRPSRAM